jgi:hypothetical protein
MCQLNGKVKSENARKIEAIVTDLNVNFATPKLPLGRMEFVDDNIDVSINQAYAMNFSAYEAAVAAEKQIRVLFN